ncbi:SHOCT domain-containing protein [Escherichia coli]|uniref:SHOCT domain-containing protein n=1 Tax=Escherichia coli TaxID=562 RepID=UPI001C2BA67A|nr:SHOCT domain-containing protein [Escherichia coli]MBV0379892.1 SHOCT domain-containing protein [Escherichia coli]MBV0389185.1 SHOCT domain-containing protein [Escherichia coli]MBV0409685.1 SHOCT domain-containing protein [Escherichia coli]MBV0418963.1 SHOCT domain-containing protein [Escherichia coli]MCF1403203.1 SHOCT domain-containing protein [Escherichia coli]
MANSRYDVEIRGDNKGLSTAVKDSMDELNKLDSAAQGLFSNFTGPLNGLSDGLSTIQSMSPALRALGAAGLVAGAGFAAINKAAETVNVLNQVNTTTGVSIEMLQQLQSTFKATGMDVEKFGDLNKDAMDKLGDSLRAGGGGIADDLEEWGLKLEDYAKYAGDAEGGIKALIDTFYQLRAAGKSSAEITNAMESMASDGSHLISTLQNFSNTQDALNAIQGQTVSITQDVADEFKEYERNMNSLKKATNEFTVEAASPLVREFNNLYEWMDGIDWSETSFAKWLRENNKKGITPSGMSSGQVQNIGKSVEAIEIEKRQAFIAENAKLLKKQVNQLVRLAEQETMANKARQKVLEEKAKKEKDAADKAERERKSAADKAERERKAAMAKAKADYDKMMADRAQAVESLKQLDVAVIAQEGRSYASQINQTQQALTKLQELRDKGIISQEQFLERRNSLLINSSKEFSDSLKANPADIGIITQSMNQMFDIQKQELDIKRQQNLISEQQYNEQLENLQIAHQEKMKAIKEIDANQVNMQNLNSIGFATDEERMALEQEALNQQFERFREQNQKMYESGLLSHELFLEQKRRLDKAYSVQSENIAMMEIQTKMGMYNGFAQGMAGVISGISGENSKAAQAAFAVAKGTAIANGMLNAYQSATKAMATYPGPLGYALAASSYAQVLGQVMSMKSVNMTGMAHDGISEIPREGTWLLDGGERVVDQRTNGDLKDFLNNQSESKTQPIDARVIVQGNVTDQRWFAEQLKKQEKIITSIVQSGNRRKM